jgi:hypothetical protein
MGLVLVTREAADVLEWAQKCSEEKPPIVLNWPNVADKRNC